MSEQVNKEQTKDAKQEKITELSEGELDEVVGGETAYLRSDPSDTEESGTREISEWFLDINTDLSIGNN